MSDSDAERAAEAEAARLKQEEAARAEANRRALERSVPATPGPPP